MNLTQEQRDELIESFAERVVNDMPLEHVIDAAQFVVIAELSNLENEQLVATIKESHPDLLDQVEG